MNQQDLWEELLHEVLYTVTEDQGHGAYEYGSQQGKHVQYVAALRPERGQLHLRPSLYDPETLKTMPESLRSEVHGCRYTATLEITERDEQNDQLIVEFEIHQETTTEITP